ncbi:hypothetical protein PsorP6_015596 [Peronosclerospora sorghi]|uniref:Uncharacterized protein n=1 Tax=Peronosclerospora sorghi TaxID=230839 RepID=A0ACC0WRC1_9STRA|nr:hypothetical protein PsorP6_015596 [Peronosclerospora sorghi]
MVTTGKVRFTSQGNAVFRFSISPTKIWLEHHATKQQWQAITSASDFALKDETIPHDIVMNYLACLRDKVGLTIRLLQACLSGTDASEKCTVDLINLSKDRLRLDFAIEFSVAEVTWRPVYQFVLHPIAMSTKKILKSKLHDADETLSQLHAIIPAWVVEENYDDTMKKEKVMQIIALKGVQSWFYLCDLARRALDLFEFAD